MKQKFSKPKVFFNASVILAGLKSPTGGSGKLLDWSKEKIINAVISEVVANEVERNASKLGLYRSRVHKLLNSVTILEAPNKETVRKYNKIVIDEGDRHFFASAKQSKSRYLVSLDKKHVLSLKNKIKWTKIISPGKLITTLATSH